MSDLISRQAAIDALNEYFARIGKLKRRGLTKGEKAISLDTVGAIKTLPPAQLGANLAEVGTDCISRKAAIDGKICIHRANGVEIYDDYVVPVEYLEQLQPAQPAQPERIRGRWIPSDTDGFVCSVCRNGYRNQPTLMGKPMFEFCPVCGADMREVTE